MNNVRAHSPCCFLSDPLKRDFLGIDLTIFLGVRNFGNTSAMRVIFFGKCSKLKVDFKNEKKIQKKFFVFEIITREFVALKCPYQVENTSHRHPEC